jgi:uncharacterized membrane protein
MNISTRQIVITGALGAISILLGVTKIGFIPFFLGTSITIMHVPVIIGAILEGPWVGTSIGFIFGIFSLVWAYIGPNGPGDVYFQKPLISILPRLFIGLMAFLAYRLVRKETTTRSAWVLWLAVGIAVASPVIAYSTTLFSGEDMKVFVLLTSLGLGVLAALSLYFRYTNQGEIGALGASAIVGSMTNTILVLLMIGIMGEVGQVPKLPWSVLLTLGITNGIPEAIAALLITVSVVAALKQIEFGRKGARIFRD